MTNQLSDISPDKIHKNPDNPRIIFRQDELESLMLSIDRHGIQVPITVYKEGTKYILLDGERRWRSAIKLNLRKIPAIIQPKPDRLENLLLMSNIHALREQWDYITIAMNMEKIINLFQEKNNSKPNEKELSELTGLTRGQIRRCQLLLDLPAEHRDKLLQELKLPKSQQKLSEDFFIEMESALKTVKLRFSEFEGKLPAIRDVLIDKYRNGTINAVTDFRKLSKIATSYQKLNITRDQAKDALQDIFKPRNKRGIAEVYEESSQVLYAERSANIQVEHLIEFLEKYAKKKSWSPSDEKFRSALIKLFRALKAIEGRLK